MEMETATKEIGQAEEMEFDWDFFECLDYKDLKILYRIYKEGSFALPCLSDELEPVLGIEYKAIHKRVTNLVDNGLVRKLEKTRPSIICAHKGRKGEAIKKLIFEKSAKKGLKIDRN